MIKTDIEGLLYWAFARQCVEEVTSRYVGTEYSWLSGGPGNAQAVIDYVARGGVTIDAGGWHAGDLHPDAERVYDTVSILTELDRDQAVLVQFHAKTGTRPDYCEGAETRIESIVNKKGKPKMIYDRSRHPIACAVRIVNPPGHIEFERRRYRLWQQGILWVLETLPPLSDHVVTGPPPAAEPWLD